MTKSDLIDQVSAMNSDMTKKQVEFIINTLFDSVKETLKKGEKVTIQGFGTFNVRANSPKNGRNPKSGVYVKVPAKISPFFKPSKDIKTALIKP